MRSISGLTAVSSAISPQQYQVGARRFALEVLGVGGLLGLVTAGFFWQILFLPDTWMPAGGGDLAPFIYPNYRFAAEQIRQGIIPLWNPHLYSGSPFAADIQSGLFYPVNLLVFLLVPELTYEWLEYLAVFHFWLAGVMMYVCLRRLRPAAGEPGPVGLLPALAGAIAFEFSDLFIVHFGNLNMIAVAAWLPLIFLLFHLALRKASPGLAAASGAVLAVATLAGHIQITLFILLMLGLYALWQGWLNLAGTGPPAGESQMVESPGSVPLGRRLAAAGRPLLFLLVSLGVTVGLSALLLLPAYEMSRYTPRAELPYQEAIRYSLHPVQLAGLLAPDYFGRDPALHWGPWERVETGYIGILTLLLALFGAVFYSGQLKKYFIGLGLVALLLAMGGYAPLHGWLYTLVPGFNQLRAPARFIVLLDFSLAILAAFGLQQLLAAVSQQVQAQALKMLKVLAWVLGGLIVVSVPLSYYAMLVTQDQNPAIFLRASAAAAGVMTFSLLAAASLVVLYLVITRRLNYWQAGLAAVILIGLDLFILGQNVDVGQMDPTAGFDHPAALAFLEQDPNLYRVEVSTDVWHAWQPNTALLHGLYDSWGLYNPLTLADTTLYWSGSPPRSSGRYNFLGVKYIIASKAGAPADGNIVPVFADDPAINVYLNQSALARALFVGQAHIVANHDEAWEAVRAEDFDPETTVVLESGRPVDSRPASSLSFVEYGLTTVTISVDTDQPGYLVLSDAFYPGWQATVDGRPEPIHRANYAFRAVYVPAGQHLVRFSFQPAMWRIGLAASGLTLLGLLAWAGRAWRQRARQTLP